MYTPIILGLTMAIACLEQATAAADPADRGIPWQEDAQDPRLLSLGPVGARVQVDHLEENLPESRSSSGTVAYIYRNGPAEGRLQLDDVVVGVGGQPFQKDFSRRMSRAIDAAEGGDGRLVLNVQRGPRRLEVAFTLERLGAFAPTYPYDCRKSAAILRRACDWLAGQQNANGKLEGDPQSGYSVCTAVAGLAWLGSGDRRYAPNLEKVVAYYLDYFRRHRTADGHFGGVTLELWQLVYGAMFLAEYHLQTGDPRLPPLLCFLDDEIDSMQFRHLPPAVMAAVRQRFPQDGAPPYWFGHQRVEAGNLGSYLHLGVNTANALTAWGLLARCGVPVRREVLDATLAYTREACPSGEMGYAGRPHQPGGDSDSFGRTGMLALAYRLHDGDPAYRQRIVQALERHHPQHFFVSHSSAVMGKAWGAIGAAALDPLLLRRMLDLHGYDFDLIRLHDGRFVANPAHWNQPGHPNNDLRDGYGDGHRWTTAFNALFFALGQRRLRIFGAPAVIPGVDRARLVGEAVRAYDLVATGRYAEAREMLERLLKGGGAEGVAGSQAQALLRHVRSVIETMAKARTPPGG